MLEIGIHHFDLGLSLAPLAGYTDHAMRALCYAQGADFSTTEMISAKAVCYGDRKTPLLARIYEADGPVSLQLFGSEPSFMAEAARRLYDGMTGGVSPFAFDINMGCPVPKVAGNGEGSALMKSPALVEAIVGAMVKATPLPVTVKIRAGWDEAHINAPEVARAAEAGGAAAVCVHARTRTQMYSGRADISVIAAVCRSVKIPVIGNGDITTPAAARRMREETGCHGIAIGRAAVGNPFIFREIRAALEGREITPPTGKERYDAALALLVMRIKEKGSEVGVLESRKQLATFLSGFRDAAACRAEIYRATTPDEMKRALSPLLALDGEM